MDINLTTVGKVLVANRKLAASQLQQQTVAGSASPYGRGAPPKSPCRRSRGLVPKTAPTMRGARGEIPRTDPAEEKDEILVQQQTAGELIAAARASSSDLVANKVKCTTRLGFGRPNRYGSLRGTCRTRNQVPKFHSKTVPLRRFKVD